MPIDATRVTAEAFFLYAETYLPDAEARDATLAALASCAEGTHAVAPSVATYIFRPSPLAQMLGDRLYPGSLALESTELYLTHGGFRDHIETASFRAGLRTMYKGTKRLGARIFWIGARPAPDMLRNIFKSDPEARPVMPVREALFDADRYAAARHEDVAMVSLSVQVPAGQGAVAIEAVDALADALVAISFIAFFHPLALELLRVFFVAPIDAENAPDALAPLAAAGDLTGHVQLHRASNARESLATALAGVGRWSVATGGYSGYPSHSAVATN